MSMTSKVMYLVQGFFGVPKDTGSVMAPTSSILFPSVDEDFGYIPSVDEDYGDHGIGVRE
jgi:hypothetical protein